ncbi:probable beta-1,3-galactosyltransferase 2 isoform X1, partial [Tanacetum coccineum]
MYGKLLSGPNPPDLPVLTATLRATLAKHRVNPQVYIGCMKSGPVLAHKGVRYHETEHWKFREEGNKYFRYATRQLYAISKDLATYISINQNMLHKYVNEDVSLGSWFIGLDVEYIDDRKLCCGTPPGTLRVLRLSSGISRIDGRTLSLDRDFAMSHAMGNTNSPEAAQSVQSVYVEEDSVESETPYIIFTTHNDIDIRLFSNDIILGLKSPNSPFSKKFHLLRWKLETKDVSRLPLRKRFLLEDVVITVHLPTLSEALNVELVHGDWRSCGVEISIFNGEDSCDGSLKVFFCESMDSTAAKAMTTDVPQHTLKKNVVKEKQREVKILVNTDDKKGQL